MKAIVLVLVLLSPALLEAASEIELLPEISVAETTGGESPRYTIQGRVFIKNVSSILQKIPVGPAADQSISNKDGKVILIIAFRQQHTPARQRIKPSPASLDVIDIAPGEVAEFVIKPRTIGGKMNAFNVVYSVDESLSRVVLGLWCGSATVHVELP